MAVIWPKLRETRTKARYMPAWPACFVISLELLVKGRCSREQSLQHASLSMQPLLRSRFASFPKFANGGIHRLFSIVRHLDIYNIYNRNLCMNSLQHTAYLRTWDPPVRPRTLQALHSASSLATAALGDPVQVMQVGLLVVRDKSVASEFGSTDGLFRNAVPKLRPGQEARQAGVCSCKLELHSA